MISEKHIMDLVRKYAKSPEGKAEIKRVTGVDYDPSKDPRAAMRAYGNQMKRILYNHIHEKIESIIPSDIIVQEPYKDTDGSYRVVVSFAEGALHRESLDPKYFKEGLGNIVLLFSKGYRARNYVYGVWNRRGSGASYKMRSRKIRGGSDFLSRAVSEFNRSVDSKIARAELLGEYKD